MAPKKTSVATKNIQDVPPVPIKNEQVTPVEPTGVPSDTVMDVNKFAVILDKLQLFVNEAKEIMVQVKTIQKEYAKLEKQTSKKNKKSENTTKRTPSGFAVPTKLSDTLCDFLGVAKGSSMARTVVTKHINEYIKKNDLQDSADKRHILPDNKLKGILTLKDGDKLTYFNLQSYIKHHFIKETPSV